MPWKNGSASLSSTSLAVRRKVLKGIQDRASGVGWESLKPGVGRERLKPGVGRERLKPGQQSVFFQFAQDWYPYPSLLTSVDVSLDGISLLLFAIEHYASCKCMWFECSRKWSALVHAAFSHMQLEHHSYSDTVVEIGEGINVNLVTHSDVWYYWTMWWQA